MLDAEGLSKRFGTTLVLDNVALAVHAGEIRGLLGANGSGKSTLIKILAGFHVPDGHPVLSVAGTPVTFPMAPETPRKLGLSFVHQDLALIPCLSVADNLALSGASYGPQTTFVRYPQSERTAMARTLKTYGIEIDPWTRVDELSRLDRALIAIVRAVEALRAQTDSGILVLDEPTASLPAANKSRVANLVREIVAAGNAVIFVSHDLEEVTGLCDTLTVLRDGKAQATERTAEVSVARIVHLIVGVDETPQLGSAESAASGPAAASGVPFRLREAFGGVVKGMDLDVSPGEIVGVAGLVGSGHDVLPYLAYGAWEGASGVVECDGRQFSLRRFTPVDAIRNGMALVPAERQEDAIVPSLSVSDNVMLPVISRHVRKFMLRNRDLETAAKSLLEKFDVRPPDPRRLIGQLSGGNQQRAVLAKWANSGARVILMHEPTQGVDVRAREYIHLLVKRMADSGRSFLIASSDHEELASICDRVVIMRGGRSARQLSRQELTKEKITETCLQIS